MAETENFPPSSTMSIPPPQTYAGAPGQQQYDSNTTNGQGNPAHMPPPPLPPVVIPQNTNPIPTAVASPNSDPSSGLLGQSPNSASFIRRAAPEPNKRALYVGGLEPRVTEDILRQIFETTGHVHNVKIIPDKTMGAVCIPFFSSLELLCAVSKSCCVPARYPLAPQAMVPCLLGSAQRTNNPTLSAYTVCTGASRMLIFH